MLRVPDTFWCPPSFWCHEFFRSMFIDGLLEALMRKQRWSRRDLEDMVLHPAPSDRELTWPYYGALWLAAVGALEGPDSRLGTTRQEALACIRQRLAPKDADTVAWAAAMYDATAPHPPASTYLLGEQVATTP